MTLQGPIHKDALTVVGIETRTTNSDESRGETARIPGLWQRFFQENIRNTIPNQVQPGSILAVYTDYESDEHGPYTLLIGCEVSSLGDLPEGLSARVLPESGYMIYTTRTGPVASVIGQAWREIWQLGPEQLGGRRRYSADFELYDERSSDPQQTTVDIYLSIT
ncbi:GyrI-like domain-containing protein [Dictyobacter aurantiacus]|uniref:DNA-binding protein n=1 Tax=Dictyobacter aurantiacus TaxID=1936993 RepID=A0A401ZJT9_9CHLR|nr:GyrI-like domain-containing protein [Dictyobacter aurantiacus]GCE07109.1 DNA-binding protein [Dictyobacter aurantiacus]